jgi:hypothetical protein
MRPLRQKSSRIRRLQREYKDNYAPIRHNGVVTDDDIIHLVENFDFDAGPVRT